MTRHYTRCVILANAVLKLIPLPNCLIGYGVQDKRGFQVQIFVNQSQWGAILQTRNAMLPVVRAELEIRVGQKFNDGKMRATILFSTCCHSDQSHIVSG